MSNIINIALMGAGIIGKQHIKAIKNSKNASLMAIIDPSPAAEEVAKIENVPLYTCLKDLMNNGKPDGIIIATPNQMHFQNGMDAIAAGLPLIMEKPICDDFYDARKLVEAAENANIPILVGHHRRHNPILLKAKEIIESGDLGKIISSHAMCWFYKPDDYFDIPWHRKTGAGPIIINAIHDIDSMRFLFGDLLSIQAVHANNARGYEVEDTAAALLTFESGIISTLTVSDAIVSPFNWEMTSAENPDYPVEAGFSCLVGGTKGCLSIPSLEVKTNASHYSWKEKILTKQNSTEIKSPLTAQIENFHGVITNSVEPKVSGREGLETLKIALAIKVASRTGNTIILQDFEPTIIV